MDALRLPHSEEAEQALVARLMLNPTNLTLMAGMLSAEDFFVAPYRDAYGAMVELNREGRGIDTVTLAGKIGQSRVDVLDLDAGARAPLEEYAGIIREHAKRRRAMGALERALRLVQSEKGDPFVAISEAYQSLVTDRGDEANVTSSAHAVEEYLQLMVLRETQVVQGLTYNLPALDRIVNPAEAGELIIIAARPGVGKTAMAEWIADHWGRAGKGTILFASLEMRVTALLHRAAARETGIDARKIINGVLTPEEAQRVTTAMSERVAVRNIVYIDDFWLTTAKLRARAASERMRGSGRLGAIVVDYLQLLKDNHTGDNMVQRVTQISNNLKAISGEFDCPVLALAQLNRSAVGENPQLHQLRESGALEQDAHTVVMLAREEGAREMKVYVRKQRQGPTGFTKVIFDPQAQQFLEWGEPDYGVNPGRLADALKAIEVIGPDASGDLSWE